MSADRVRPAKRDQRTCLKVVGTARGGDPSQFKEPETNRETEEEVSHYYGRKKLIVMRRSLQRVKRTNGRHKSGKGGCEETNNDPRWC